MNNEIEKLKQFRAPWWARWLGNFRAYCAARAARNRNNFIASINLWVRVNSDGPPFVDAHIQLFETGTGVRSFKVFPGQVLREVELHTMYHNVVIPWAYHKYSNASVMDWAKRLQNIPTVWY